MLVRCWLRSSLGEIPIHHGDMLVVLLQMDPSIHELFSCFLYSRSAVRTIS
uniref:Uncharacterized protein n=1 Tax=Arundo donax TaxID=35708 RepID=A0A0A8Z5J6_ARUDO